MATPNPVPRSLQVGEITESLTENGYLIGVDQQRGGAVPGSPRFVRLRPGGGQGIFIGTAVQTVVNGSGTAPGVGGGLSLVGQGLSGSHTAPEVSSRTAKIGGAYKVDIRGRFSTPGSAVGNLTINLIVGSTIVGSAVFSPAVSASGAGWRLDAVLIVTGVGATGKVLVTGQLEFWATASTRNIVDINSAGVGLTVDLTQDEPIDVQAVWATPASTKILTSDSVIFSRLR
jgi:hypothetical protein